MARPNRPSLVRFASSQVQDGKQLVPSRGLRTQFPSWFYSAVGVIKGPFCIILREVPCANAGLVGITWNSKFALPAALKVVWETMGRALGQRV